MISTTAVISVLLPALICYFVVVKIWSVYFGGLSAIPGPKLAAATRLVLLIHKARGDAETWRLQLHRRYGPAVRVGPSEVSFAGGTAWKEVYGSRSGSQYAIMQTDPLFYTGAEKEPSIVSANEIDHHRQRKVFSHAFAERALREQEPLIKHYTAQLVSNIHEVAKAPGPKAINIAAQYNFTTFDIMSDLAFGAPLGCLAKSEYVTWVSNIFEFLKAATIVQEVNRVKPLKKMLDMMVPASIKEKERDHFRFSADRVDKRLAETTSRKDIWHFVLAAEEKNLTISRGEMHANAALFMLAGSETTATLLSALTYYLTCNPDKLGMLVREIRDHFTSADQITVQEVLPLKYLTACAYEALRMHPPVPIGLPRLVPAGGAEVCGYNVSEGTCVYAHQLSMYRSADNFSHPDTFLPQRWLVDNYELKDEASDGKGNSIDNADFLSDKRSCLQPFSIGPRNCLGQNLAWLEIRLIMANIIWHFDLELCEESRGWDEQQIFTLWISKPLMVIATPVNR